MEIELGSFFSVQPNPMDGVWYPAEVVEVTDEVKVKYWCGNQYKYFSFYKIGWHHDKQVRPLREHDNEKQ